MSEPVIRKMRPDDVEQVLRLGQDNPEFSVSESAPGFWSEKQLLRWSRSREDLMLVAEADGEIVGFSFYACHIPTGKAQWENLWVHPAWRHQGVGTRLAETALSSLRKRRFTILVGFAKAGNAAGLGFLQRYGLVLGERGIWVDRRI